jgi:hypothetical protein
MERQSKVAGIDRLELENCAYSRATLNSLSLILSAETYADCITGMRRTGLDYKNPVGIEAYKVFRIYIIERNKSEGSCGTTVIKPRSPRSPKAKIKSAHKITEIDGDKSDEEPTTRVFAVKVNSTKCYLTISMR